jgi:putative nucleotidyltransferase with HDIG domain
MMNLKEREGWEKSKRNFSFIDDIEELRALPSLILEIMAMLSADDFDIKEVEEKIKLDPAMAAYILKFCNSPFLGIKVPVVRLGYALGIIGPSTLKTTLMAYFLRNLFFRSARKDISNYLWEHSVQVGIIARELATALKKQEMKEEVYLAGLLHDIGKLVIYFKDPGRYEKILLETDVKRESVLQVELEQYGYHHAEAGHYLLNRWQLSDLLKDSVLYHHDIEEYRGNYDAVKIAAFANSTFHFAVDRQGQLPEFWLETFELPERKYAELVEEILQVLADSQKQF